VTNRSNISELNVNVLDLTRDSARSLRQMYESLGVSSSILGSFRTPSSSILDDIRKLGLGIDKNQLLSALSTLGLANPTPRFDVRALGLMKFDGLTAMDPSLGLSSDLIKLMSVQKAILPQSLMTDIEQVTRFTRSLGTASDLAATFQAMDRNQLLSTVASYRDMTKAIGNLPSWLRPESPLEAMRPSWEVAAGLALAGIGRPGLVHDALSAIHSARAETAGFEAVVQMLEAVDEAEDDLDDRVLIVLRSYAAGLIDLLEQSKDWVQRQGLMAMLMLILGIIGVYDNHRSRVDADIQTKIAVEQDHSTHAQAEIARHRDDLTQSLSRFLAEKDANNDARVLNRAAPLRATPQPKGFILRQLYPDDRVRVLEVQDSWARVEVYGYSSENVIKGWVNRRALRLYQR